jgi:hypothetical protein
MPFDDRGDFAPADHLRTGDAIAPVKAALFRVLLSSP